MRFQHSVSNFLKKLPIQRLFCLKYFLFWGYKTLTAKLFSEGGVLDREAKNYKICGKLEKFGGKERLLKNALFAGKF